MSAINVNIKDFEAANPKRSEIFNTAGFWFYYAALETYCRLSVSPLEINHYGVLGRLRNS